MMPLVLRYGIDFEWLKKLEVDTGGLLVRDGMDDYNQPKQNEDILVFIPNPVIHPDFKLSAFMYWVDHCPLVCKESSGRVLDTRKFYELSGGFAAFTLAFDKK